MTRYNSRNRVFSITLSQEIMENYLEKRGYQISTLSQIAKDFGYSAGKLMEELNLLSSTFDYKVAYLQEEKEKVYQKFIKIIEDEETKKILNIFLEENGFGIIVQNLISLVI